MPEATDYSAELRRRRIERPFRPFEICTLAGDRLRVTHPFAFAMSARGFLVPGEGGPFRFADIATIVDTQMVEGAH